MRAPNNASVLQLRSDDGLKCCLSYTCVFSLNVSFKVPCTKKYTNNLAIVWLNRNKIPNRIFVVVLQ